MQNECRCVPLYYAVYQIDIAGPLSTTPYPTGTEAGICPFALFENICPNSLPSVYNGEDYGTYCSLDKEAQSQADCIDPANPDNNPRPEFDLRSCSCGCMLTDAICVHFNPNTRKDPNACKCVLNSVGGGGPNTCP